MNITDSLIFNIVNHELRESEKQRELKLIRQNLRDVSNPFELPDNYFLKTFRLNKDATKYVIEQLEPYFDSPQRQTGVPIFLQILSSIHFFGHGSYQLNTGASHIFGLSQPAISRCLRRTCNAIIAKMIATWIRFPQTQEEVRRNEDLFNTFYNMPGAIGAIDCTHVAIVPPPANHPVYPKGIYFNRKGYCSINTQIICDPKMVILNINARFPGSVHDSAIWMSSNIKKHLRDKYLNAPNERTSYLIGDSGYPLEPWMMVPIEGAPRNTPESRYNYRHAQARNVIERVNGVLKGRFRCLIKDRTLHYDPAKAAQIIYSCGVLHNVAIRYNAGMPEDSISELYEDLQDNAADEGRVEVDSFYNVGQQRRNELVSMF